MMQDDRSGSDLFRELRRVLPSALVEEYYKGGRWEVETLVIDIELMERHRQEAGAPEPPPLEEIPVPVLPDAVLPPWQASKLPPAPYSRLPLPGPPRTPPPASAKRSSSSSVGFGVERNGASVALRNGVKRKPENGSDREPPKQARTTSTPHPSAWGLLGLGEEPKSRVVESTYTRPTAKMAAKPITTVSEKQPWKSANSDSRRAVRPSQNPALSFASRETTRENTRSSARSSRDKPNPRLAKEKAGEQEPNPGDLISLLLG